MSEAQPETLIRPAEPDDTPAIARIHVAGWRWAYRGQLPDAYLEGLSEGRREAGWRETISSRADEHVWIAEQGQRIVGFASAGPNRDADAVHGTGEVYAIYLDPEVVSTGVGRILFAHVVGDLRACGYRCATLWVLETNIRTRRFYERADWRPDGSMKTEKIGEVELREVRYRTDFAAS